MDAIVSLDRLAGANLQTDEEIIRRAHAAWCRLEEDRTWEDWIAVGEAHLIGRAEAMREAHTNCPVGRRYNAAFGDWIRRYGFEAIDKGDRSRLFDVMAHRHEIEAWRRATLTTTERLRLNHPNSVLRKWRATQIIPKDETTKLSPLAKLQELVIEIARLKRDLALADGGTISAKDTAKDIAGLLVRNISESKFDEVVREARKQYRTKLAQREEASP